MMAHNVKRVLARLAIKVEDERRDELWALCPAHEDSNPSWSINRKSGLHKCLACQFGGNLVGLVAKLLGFTGEWDGGAQSVAEWLEGDAEKEPAKEIPPTFEVATTLGGSRPFRLPPEVVFGKLADWPAPARRYVVEERGIPEEQAERWGLGYATGGSLRGRIVIVIRDGSRSPASYMARDFTEGARQKYLYPKKEERADYDVMFGEEFWGPRMTRDVVLVAEGALKALALERASGRQVAALGGSQIRPLHALKLSTFDRVVYVRDGGEAGEEAWLDVRANLGRHAGLDLVEMPEGHDADSLALKDFPELLRRLAPFARHS